MTAKEKSQGDGAPSQTRLLAEKILQAIFPDGVWESTREDTLDDIESLLSEALEEAGNHGYRKGFEDLQKHRFESLAQARAEGVKEGKKHASHCGSCHEDQAQGYASSDECSPYCCCEGMRAEDDRVKEAKQEAYEHCAKIARNTKCKSECHDHTAEDILLAAKNLK